MNADLPLNACPVEKSIGRVGSIRSWLAVNPMARTDREHHCSKTLDDDHPTFECMLYGYKTSH